MPQCTPLISKSLPIRLFLNGNTLFFNKIVQKQKIPAGNLKYYAVGWFEIYVQDIERAKKFYEEVFQVELTDLDDPRESTRDNEMKMVAFPYSMEDLPGATGALVQMEGMPSGGNSTIVYFSSLDCSVEEGRAVAAGGKVVKSKMSIGEHGFMSLIQDTEGNMVGIHSMK